MFIYVSQSCFLKVKTLHYITMQIKTRARACHGLVDLKSPYLVHTWVPGWAEQRKELQEIYTPFFWIFEVMNNNTETWHVDRTGKNMDTNEPGITLAQSKQQQWYVRFIYTTRSRGLTKIYKSFISPIERTTCTIGNRVRWSFCSFSNAAIQKTINLWGLK
jgi:hypothetical protein